MSDVTEDHINQFWNQVASSGGSPEAKLESTLAETIGRLHSLSSAPVPGSARERARQRVFESIASSKENTMSAMTPVIPFPIPGGAASRARSPWLPDVGLRRPKARWALASLAAAIVILVAGIGSYFTIFDKTEQPAIIPAVTQESTPSTDVPMYRGNPGRTGEMPGPGPKGDPVELWMFQTEGPIKSAPAIVGTTLVVGSDDGNIYALDSTTGSELWRVETGAPVGTSPAVADGIVYAGSANGFLALDLETGEEIWRLSTVLSEPSPVVADGVVYIGSADEKLYALDAATGEEIWQSPLGAPASRSAAVADGIVYTGSTDGVLHAVAADTGAEVWTMDAGPNTVVFTTTVSDGVVYQATEAAVNVFYALDAATGEELWRLDDPSGRRLSAVSGDTAYMASEVGDLLAVDVATAEERWTFPTGETIGAAPAAVGDTIYVCSRNGKCFALDASSGEELWQLQMDAWTEFGPVVSGGVLYVGTQAGSVYAFGDPGSATAVASTSPIADDSEASPVEFLWQSFGGPDPLTAPVDSAVDPDGNLWVSDACNNRFQIFSPDGDFIEVWGGEGSGPGQFNLCSGAPDGSFAFDTEGNLYVGDIYNHRVQKFGPDRGFLTEWGGQGSEDGQFMQLAGVAIDAAGNVIVCDMGRAGCQVFDNEGAFLFSFGRGEAGGDPVLIRPSYVTVDAEGNIFVADVGHNQVFKFDAEGVPIAALGDQGFEGGKFISANDVAVDSAGNIYVADEGARRVQVFDSSGDVLTEWDSSSTPTGDFAPSAIHLDDAGNVYVTEIGTNTVKKFDLLPPLGTEG